MFHIAENRRHYFLLSALIIIPGLLAMIYSMIVLPTHTPFRVGIDFTGGTLWEVTFTGPVVPGDVRTVFVTAGYPDTLVTTLGDAKTAEIRTKPLDDAGRTKLLQAMRDKFGSVTEVQFASVGPTIGAEVTQAAALAVVAMAFVILIFLVIAFRKAPNPIRFGVSAVVAMGHDLLVTLGIFSILSLLLGWEADALFLTAVLTMLGFSVQDTIVVFDRIRENIPKYRGEPLRRVVDRSLLETLHRSLAIHLTALFVMAAILIFGGSTIKPFITVLLVGVTTGTYSSIFNASQILVGWDEGDVLGLHTQGQIEAQQQAKPSLAS
jgi:preprotein translocase SecF subunit